MANKRASPINDPLVQIVIKIRQSQKIQIDNLNESASSFIRKCLDNAFDNHKAEISELKDELRSYELHASFIKAQLVELEQESNKQQDINDQKEKLITTKATDLIKELQRNGGNFKEIRRVLKHIEPGIKSKYNGSSESIIKEIENRVIETSRSKGVILHGV